MNFRETYRPLVTLEELKRNLRVTDSLFDENMRIFLGAATSQAGRLVGRDLDIVRLYVGEFSETIHLQIDPAMHISQVEIDGVRVNTKDWCYSAGYLNIYRQADEGSQVKIITEYNWDIKAAVILHATALFLNPTDTVESLPKASVNLLKQYRKYEL